VFRKEDIGMMSFKGANKELGHKKQNYSLFLYKGGVNCKHLWERRVYKKKVSENTEVEASDAKEDGFNEPNNPKEVGVRPSDMKDRGSYPTNKK